MIRIIQETLTINELVKREGLYYKKFTNNPFNGEVLGKFSGKIKNGKSYGEWLIYHKNGQLWMKGIKKDGKMDGLWEFYSSNGQLWSKGEYKYGKKDGLWKFFNADDTLKKTERYKDGVKIE
tara:strand:+ start:46 stop:411 length:366 start_codon:yes stop_codon:yes gene_type:complete